MKEKTVESILFDREYFSKNEVKRILKNNNLESHIDTTKNYHRARQLDPSLFTKTSFRTYHILPGIKAIVGYLKKGH